MWSSEQLDLDAYLAHLGHEGDRSPTLETLRAVHRAHVLTVRWDTLDSFLHHEVRLDLPTVQEKLLRQGRGGYCYEHATLYAAALEKLGFRFTAVSGRIQMGADNPRPATHAMLLVELDGVRWLTDIGFGASPLAPIELRDGARLTADDGRSYELRHEAVVGADPGWALYEQPDDPEKRLRRHIFTENPQYPVDYAVGNHFVASNARSPFVIRPFVQRLRTDRLDQLDALVWTTERPGREPVKETVRADEVPKLLADVFDIRVARDEAELLVSRLTALVP
ncbi:arylamine N-acetyltransferase [Streptomyces sp. NPDC048172]|uniref:arylamine N-acetyltransferase family protein n=1 Tax=Streptomyces sp. NPDC048172 TaxID=3365505 RepID=UPI00371D09B8